MVKQLAPEPTRDDDDTADLLHAAGIEVISIETREADGDVRHALESFRGRPQD